eukprot:gene7711-12177_t
MNDYDTELIKQTSSHSLYHGKKNKNSYLLHKIFCHDLLDAEEAYHEIEEKCKIFHNSNFVLSIEDYFYHDSETIVYTCPLIKKNLSDVIQQQKKINENFSFDEIINTMQQICFGIKWIHNNNQYHGSLNSTKILLKQDYVVISGFYLHASLKEEEFTFPILKEKISTLSDVFLLGLIIFEMINLQQTDFKQLKKTNFSKDYPIEFINLLFEMIEKNPKKRPNISIVLKKIQKFHPSNSLISLIYLQPVELILGIVRYAKPIDILNLAGTSRKYYDMFSSDLIWKYYVENFSYYPTNVNINEFNVNSYKELYLLKPWTISSKQISKGIKLNKEKNEIENITKFQKIPEIKFASTKESLKKGKFLIRILNMQAMRGSGIGIVSERNLKIVFGSEIEEKHKYIEYMRDGSVSGLPPMWRDKMDRIRLDTDGKLKKIYFKCLTGDVLSVLLNFDDSIIQFYVNDDFDNSLLTIREVEEMKLDSPVFVVFSTSPNQKFKILKNIKFDSDPVLRAVEKTASN